MYRELIEDYFADKEPELTRLISRLVAIPSVRGTAEPGMPYGEGPARALEEALRLAGAYGLVTQNVDGYVGIADLSDEETQLHILAHLDVVDAGDGWSITEPFVPKVADGLLYGRGSADDKGPAAAALLAMRAVKELGLPLRYNARLILGTDEECGSSDISHYYSTHPYAPCTFSPDADFPLINTEKGQYRPLFAKTWPPSDALPRVTAVWGGTRLNMVPPTARAELRGLGLSQLQPFCDAAAAEDSVCFSLEELDGAVGITASGTAGHAAEPQKGVNALTALLHLLSTLPLAPCGSTEAIRALNRLFPHGDYLGRALGIAQRDEISGALTLSFTMLTLHETGFEGRFDSRTPLCANAENCRRAAEITLAVHGMFVKDFTGINAPHHTDAGSPFVRTLLDCYEIYTGNPGKCLSIGGGTYVHDIPGGVAFGCTMPGFDSRMHGPDERVRLVDLMTSCKIFTEAIIRICTAQ